MCKGVNGEFSLIAKRLSGERSRCLERELDSKYRSSLPALAPPFWLIARLMGSLSPDIV